MLKLKKKIRRQKVNMLIGSAFLRMCFDSHLLFHFHIFWWFDDSKSVPEHVIKLQFMFVWIGDENKDLRSPCFGVWPSEDGSSKFLQNVGNFLTSTWYHIPEDGILQSHDHENQKSHEGCCVENSHSVYSLCCLLLVDYRRINMEATTHAPLHTGDARWIGRRRGKGT